MNYTKRNLNYILFFIASAFFVFNCCQKDDNLINPLETRVYTTLDRTIIPADLSSWPVMYPYEVSKFPGFPQYGARTYGPGLDYQKKYRNIDS